MKKFSLPGITHAMARYRAAARPLRNTALRDSQPFVYVSFDVQENCILQYRGFLKRPSNLSN
jgi:hypothetical protein